MSNPYGGGQQDPYGSQNNPFGGPNDPYAAYGSPQGGQPGGPPGYGAFPAGSPGQQPAGKGMAITALVLAFIPCCVVNNIVAIGLGIAVLVRSKEGRNHGKGMAIGAIVVSLLVMIGSIVLWVAVIAAAGENVEDLESGDCVTAEGLDTSNDPVSDIEVVSCTTSHDGEVLATTDLSPEQADAYDPDDSASIGSTCGDIAPEDLAGVVSDPQYYLIGLTQDEDPSTGDRLVCIAVPVDGSSLTDPLPRD